MRTDPENRPRTIPAVHGIRQVEADPIAELELSNYLRETCASSSLLEQYSRFAIGDGTIDGLMRRAIWRCLARSFGKGVRIGSGVGFKHLETFEIGD